MDAAAPRLANLKSHNRARSASESAPHNGGAKRFEAGISTMTHEIWTASRPREASRSGRKGKNTPSEA